MCHNCVWWGISMPLQYGYDKCVLCLGYQDAMLTREAQSCMDCFILPACSREAHARCFASKHVSQPLPDMQGWLPGLMPRSFCTLSCRCRCCFILRTWSAGSLPPSVVWPSSSCHSLALALGRSQWRLIVRRRMSILSFKAVTCPKDNLWLAPQEQSQATIKSWC